ncbi:hypothetical protein [Paenisporosarcina quisquiliarum]|uniref:hypothetical protein n=1 Tax=Paenisporosarcina quisquiliarum TaxID=365346 RepID=UPI003736BF88
MSNFDKRVKEELHVRTEKHIQKMKGEIWNELEQELFTNNKGESNKLKKRKKGKAIVWLIASAALLLMLSLQSETGQALKSEIKDLFIPEKEVIQNIEGNDEKIEVQLNEGSDSEYVIYVDEERYKLTKGEESDMISSIIPPPENFPEVTMEIKQVVDEKPENLIKKIEAELKKEYPELRAIEEVTEPVTGYLLHGAGGHEPDSNIVHTYVISNGKEGSFVIMQKYFLLAAEGHGARFHRMLETFEIIE